MKRLFNLLRYIPKRVSLSILAVLAVAVPVAVVAYGPERPTFTMAHPASYVTFNSITDNPNYGDEREFMTVKDLTTGEGLGGSSKLIPGHEYQFQVYIHNNASETLNASGKGVAKDVTVRASLPQSVNGSDTADAFITASNAKPKEVYDTAKLTSDGKVELEFVNGSAMLHTNYQQTKLDNSVITTGVKVGHKDLSGSWNGCLQAAGAVTFKVKVKAQPKFEMYKQVSKHGKNEWVENLEVKPGETVDYLIYYKNTGNVQQNNVVIKDALPAGMTYVDGSSILGNSQNPNGKKISDNVTKGGVNIGHYLPNGNAWVIFSAKVKANDQLPVCNENVLKNIATVETDNGSKSDDAIVKTSKKCEKPAEVIFACTGLEVKKISKTQVKFVASKEISGAQFVKFTYVVKDANGKEISRSTNDTYSQDKAGKYTVQAYLTVKVDGKEETVTDNRCVKPFEIEQEPIKNEYACSSLDLIKKSRDTFEFKVTPLAAGNVKVSEYVFDFGDGQTLKVGAGQETQTHTYKAAKAYNAKVSINFEVDGKIVTGVTSQNCAKKLSIEPVPVVVEECKPGIPAGDSRCQETTDEPETPSEIPSTGAGTIIGGLFGFSTVGLSLNYWLGSRKAFKNSFKK